ncbi:MAG: branched chain amino acid aminotransferase, partial [Mesorhizobium sp.]
LGLKPSMSAERIVGLTWDGLKKFDGKTAVYIRPMYWAEHGGYMGVPADPASTRFCLCLYESPMISPAGFSVTVSPFRRPTIETMPTNAKAGCLYPNNGRAILE